MVFMSSFSADKEDEETAATPNSVRSNSSLFDFPNSLRNQGWKVNEISDNEVLND